MSKGRPQNTGNQYVALKDLIAKLNPNACVPLPSSFIKKYKLLEPQINSIIPPVAPVKSHIQIKELDLNTEV